MKMKQWFARLPGMQTKKAMPILSFPGATLLGVTVRELISSSDLQARCMKAVADRCDTLASVSLMDLSVEAEAFGATIKPDDHEVPTVIGCVVTDEDEVDAMAVPEVGAARTGMYIEAAQKACRLITDRPVFSGVIGPFSLSGRLMDMTEIMVNCYAEPDLVHKCMEKATAFLTAYIAAYKAAGVAGIVMAEPASGLLSPELIAEFSTPYVKRIVDALQDESFAIVYHNCGNTTPLLSSIQTIGAYGYHFGNAIDLAQTLEAMPKDVAIMGNVDPAAQFRNGTPESIYQNTIAVLKECAKYPNFVISSGCDIPPLAPWQNIDAFFRAVADFYA